jgi:epoxyqueuosine reductase
MKQKREMTMTNEFLNKLGGSDIRAAIVPVECLSRLKDDIVRFRESEALNGYQDWIVNKGYTLDVPELPFAPKSILTVAVRNKLANVVFEHEGKRLRDMYGLNQLGGLISFLGLLAPKDMYALEFSFWLPNKRLAVCSGLAEYGRNNITYIDGWGNFFTLYSYLTDMPCEGAYTWRGITNMEQCASCGVCIGNCPTKAIRENRFLIDNEICMTNFEESDQPFPDWLPERAYQSVFGCFRCQEICPKNKDVLKNITETVAFDETETGLLMAGTARDDMPESLLRKLEQLGIDDWRLKILPKSLKAIFGHA